MAFISHHFHCFLKNVRFVLTMVHQKSNLKSCELGVKSKI